MRHKIYAYTFPSHRLWRSSGGLRTRELERFKIKVGCTTRSDVMSRIKEQDTTSCAEEPELLYESDYVEFDDHVVHKELERSGSYRTRENREWFITTVSEVKEVVNRLTHGVARPNSYKMRLEQEEAVLKAYRYFESNGGGEFLWNAKMRFGKTFAAYQLMKKLEAKKTLIITYKPAAYDQWQSELDEHVDFDGYELIRAIDAGREKISLKNGNILFTSFQDILQNFELDEESTDKDYAVSIKEKFKEILDESFDLVIVDEVHFGATRDAAKKLLGMIDHVCELWLSGTPFKILGRGDLSDEQIYSWSYIDEQNKKKALVEKGLKDAKNNPYWPLPKMSVVGYGLGQSILKDLKYFDDEEKFNFEKFLHSENGTSFTNHQAVLHFVDMLADKKSDVSPFFTNRIGVDELKHTLWLVPGVNSAQALTRILRGHHFFGRYETVCVSGDNLGEGKDSLDLVRRAINKSKNTPGSKGTITISCGKLTTGVTVKEWNAIFLLSNTQSIETYFQTIFRAQSPGEEPYTKQNCYVFDFDSDRMIKMVYDYAKESCGDRTLTETVAELLNTMNLLCYSDNSFMDLDAENILDMARYGIGGSILQNKFESRNLLNLDVVGSLRENVDLCRILEKVKIFRKVGNEGTYEINSGVGKGKTKKIKFTKEEYDEEKKVRDKVNESIRQRLQRLMTRLPVFMYLSEYVEERIEHVIENLESEMFEEVAGISVEDFKELKEAGIFDLEKLNDAIRAFKVYERDSFLDRKRGTDILDVIANLSNEEVFTPAKIVNEVLDLLPEEVWSDELLEWLNPVEKSGIWLREVFKRLDVGLAEKIPDENKRHDWIKGNMLYAYTTSNIAWQMACKTMYARVESDKYIRWRDSKYIKNIKNERFLEVKDKMPKFDIVIGNPPYQENDGGHGASATPLYNLFIEKIVDVVDPLQLVFIIPSRWFSAGKGLDSFRKRMQTDRHIKIIKDFPNAKIIFPSVEIKGGVCYFLRDKSYEGHCEFNGWLSDLNKYDTIIRHRISQNVVDKIVSSKGFISMEESVLPRNPFGLATNFDKFEVEQTELRCFAVGKKLKNIETNYVSDKFGIINRWKVLRAKAQTPDIQNNPDVFIAKPKEVCTETYIVLATFDSKNEAENFKLYVKTHFFEFLLKQKVITQDVTKYKYTFVPDQLDYTKEYTDDYLYEKYGLTPEEVEFIESKFK